jgi:hypothetical protein
MPQAVKIWHSLAVVGSRVVRLETALHCPSQVVVPRWFRSLPIVGGPLTHAGLGLRAIAWPEDGRPTEPADVVSAHAGYARSRGVGHRDVVRVAPERGEPEERGPAVGEYRSRRYWITIG